MVLVMHYIRKKLRIFLADENTTTNKIRMGLICYFEFAGLTGHFFSWGENVEFVFSPW